MRHFYCLVIGLSMVSCSDKLSRTEAYKILQKEYPKKLYYAVFTADINHARKMQRAGLIEEGLVKFDSANRRIVFTEKAQQLLAPTPESEKRRKIQRVKTAERILKEITAMKVSANKAAVEYIHEIDDLTPFAKLYNKPPQKGETERTVAYFIKYDDGWRIDKSGGLEYLFE